MRESEIERRLKSIRSEKDVNRKNLKVARLVSDLFREIGCDPVVVGGSAVEFYTDGQYVSGDVDICQGGSRLPTAREREEMMARIGKPLGIRKWDVGGVYVDLFGWVETSARTPFQQIGNLKLIQIEDLIAECILVATVPAMNEGRMKVARTLLAVVLSGMVEADLKELEHVANSSDYRVGNELRKLMKELGAKSKK
jgi:hypothetical protein